MNEPQWKNDPSKLRFAFAEGESAVIGIWKLRVDKLRPNELSPIVDSLVGDLTDKEKVVLDRLSSDEERASRKRIRDEETSHSYYWSIRPARDGAATFESMGGSAGTADVAKRLALRAVEFADLTRSALS